MIVQYDSDGAFRRIFRIEVSQQTDEFDAAVAVFHARRDVTVLEIQRCQYGAGAESLVFVIATDCGMLSWHGWQIRRGVADGLYARLLVHRNSNDIGRRLAGGPSGILEPHVFFNDQDPSPPHLQLPITPST